jgi:hypothetical protein
MLRRVALVRTDVSEELIASFIRVTRNGELETTLPLTSNRRTLRRNTNFLQEPHGVTSQKTQFFNYLISSVFGSSCLGIAHVGLMLVTCANFIGGLPKQHVKRNE